MADGVTSGISALDDVIDGVRIGDNLVVQSPGGEVLDNLVDRFVDNRGDRPLVVCTSDRSRRPFPSDVIVIDVPSGPAADGLAVTRAAIAAADEEVGSDALFVFENLTSIQALWNEDAALELFLWACPRLYRRSSVALWSLDPTQHRPAFLRRLMEVTQVVVEVAVGADEDTITFDVRKADGRPRSTIGRRVQVVRDTLEATGAPSAGGEELGQQIRRVRLDRRLQQLELARRVGISGSALSQVERGVRGVSADTITRIWEVLDVPFGPPADVARGHAVSRRGALPQPESAHGLQRQRLAQDPRVGDLWRVTISPAASGRGAPFAVKTAEMVTVLHGVVDLELAGQPQTLHAGDTLTSTSDAITAWGNPGSTPTELLWVVLADR